MRRSRSAVLELQGRVKLAAVLEASVGVESEIVPQRQKRRDECQATASIATATALATGVPR